jgi:hypothetical protein
MPYHRLVISYLERIERMAIRKTRSSAATAVAWLHPQIAGWLAGTRCSLPSTNLNRFIELMLVNVTDAGFTRPKPTCTREAGETNDYASHSRSSSVLSTASSTVYGG